MIRSYLLIAVVFFLSCETSARPGVAYYTYHGARIPLALDRSRIAIKLTGDNTLPAILERTSGKNLKPVSSLALGFGRWEIAALAISFKDEEEAGSRIRATAGDSGVETISPVYLGKHNDPIILTRDVLVKMKPASAGNLKPVLGSLPVACSVIQNNFGGMSGAFRLRVASPDAYDALTLANMLVDSGYADWAEPDMIVTGSHELIPNDSLFPRLWGIHNTGQFNGTPGADMSGDLAWNITTGDSSVKVMVIDCGVQQDHPDIHQLPGIDFTGEGGNGGPVNSCDNHGTAVAGCVAGIMNNGIGIAGIAPGCYVVSARTLIANPSCDNTYSSQISWTIDALAYAGSHGIRITNFSNQFWSGPSNGLEAEYQYTHDSLNMVHFAAAGNGSTEVYYPASIPVVNAVGAMSSNGSIATFSNYGSALDFVAPGDSIWVTDRTDAAGYVPGDYKLYSGTSFASPYTAGIAALILSRFPWMTASQVEAKLKSSAVDHGDPGYDTIYGWGFVNAYNAVRSSCILTPPADILTSRDPGKAGAIVNYSPPVISGDCSTVTCIPPSGSLFPVGTTIVTCTDTTGNQCLFRVTVTGNVNTVVIRSWFDQDADAGSSFDRIPKAWGLVLYKDSVSSGTLAGFASSAESLRVSELTDGRYIAVEADSSGWAGLEIVQNGIQTAGGSSSADTFAISHGQTVDIDFIHKQLFLYRKSWNIISLPVHVADGAMTDLFPTANSSGFQYEPETGYSVVDTFVPGKGYWLRFPDNQTSVSFSGSLRHTDTIQLSEGWNLVGTLSDPVYAGSVTTIPPGITPGSFFGYSNGYVVSDTIEPYYGYWIKSDSNGVLIMNSEAGGTNTFRPASKLFATASGWNSVTIEDGEGSRQTLYFTNAAGGGVHPERGVELPPLPPEGIFDARFTDNSFVKYVDPDAGSLLPVRLSSAVPPVTVRWDIRKGVGASIEFGDEHRMMEGRGSATMASANRQLSIRVSGAAQSARQFRLEQAFPDPFNPSTTIRYSIPRLSRVTLRIFNTLGEVVSTLKNGTVEAGESEIIWNAGERPSGVYFYRLEAVSVDASAIRYTDCKKFILLK